MGWSDSTLCTNPANAPGSSRCEGETAVCILTLALFQVPPGVKGDCSLCTNSAIVPGSCSFRSFYFFTIIKQCHCSRFHQASESEFGSWQSTLRIVHHANMTIWLWWRQSASPQQQKRCVVNATLLIMTSVGTQQPSSFSECNNSYMLFYILFYILSR